MTLKITETHKKVLEILAIENNDFRFLIIEDYSFSGKMRFRNYAFELLNEGYLCGERIKRNDEWRYELKLTDDGKELIRK